MPIAKSIDKHICTFIHRLQHSLIIRRRRYIQSEIHRQAHIDNSFGVTLTILTRVRIDDDTRRSQNIDHVINLLYCRALLVSNEAEGVHTYIYICALPRHDRINVVTEVVDNFSFLFIRLVT